MSNEKITVLVSLHAILLNLAYAQESGPIKLTVPLSAHVADILPLLELPAIEVVYSLNAMIMDASAPLKDGDRVNIIPAISGG